jgi:chromosome segregation ATPase
MNRREVEDDRQPLIQDINNYNSSHNNNNNNMSSQREDPFYTVRDNVNSQLERIRARYDKFEDLVNVVNTATDESFKELRRGLTKEIRNVEKDIKGLQVAIDMVDKNRSKFAHIKDSELSSRKGFVSGAQDSLNYVKNGMESSSIRRKIDEDENRQRKYENNNGGMNPMSKGLSIEEENHSFIQDQRQQTQFAIREQDMALDELGMAVDKLHVIGRGVNEELKEQNRMLDDLDRDLDEAGGKMNFVQEALSKLLKTKDGCQIWTIVILFLILCILVALIIWT